MLDLKVDSVLYLEYSRYNRMSHYYSIDVSSIRGRRKHFLVSESDLETKAGKIVVEYLLQTLKVGESLIVKGKKISREDLEEWLNTEINSHPKDYDVPFKLEDDLSVSIWTLDDCSVVGQIAEHLQGVENNYETDIEICHKLMKDIFSKMDWRLTEVIEDTIDDFSASQILAMLKTFKTTGWPGGINRTVDIFYTTRNMDICTEILSSWSMKSHDLYEECLIRLLRILQDPDSKLNEKSLANKKISLLEKSAISLVKESSREDKIAINRLMNSFMKLLNNRAFTRGDEEKEDIFNITRISLD